MERKIICIGDNVWDKYLSRGKMYPGGQSVNTCVYACMKCVSAAYFGQIGDDGPAEIMRGILGEKGIDYSRSRQYPGENGFAVVTMQGSERVFLGSNKGGVACANSYGFTREDFAYIRGFDLLYTNINCHIEGDLPALAGLGVPIAFDFSDRWTPAYLSQVCPSIKVACLSCAHLPRLEMEAVMKETASYGVPLVLATRGEEGSCTLYGGRLTIVPALPAEKVLDTMGAGDSYLAALLCELLKASPAGALLEGDLTALLPAAMEKAGSFAAKVCGMEGAFGCGIPIAGRTELEEWEKMKPKEVGG